MRSKALLLVGVSAWMIGCNKADLVSPPEGQIQAESNDSRSVEDNSQSVATDEEIQDAGESVAETAQLPDRTNPTNETFELNTEDSEDAVQLDDLPLSLEPPQNTVDSTGTGRE